tara:strand:+ start:685 stop:894 length:210 start_codon:yes stop_codon:yes gene_type:complete
MTRSKHFSTGSSPWKEEEVWMGKFSPLREKELIGAETHNLFTRHLQDKLVVKTWTKNLLIISNQTKRNP